MEVISSTEMSQELYERYRGLTQSWLGNMIQIYINL